MNSDAKHLNGTASADESDRQHDRDELRRLNAELERQAAHLREVNQTLIDREQRLRLAIETGRIGLWVWNSTDVNNSGDWSQRLKEIFGMPLDAEVTHDMFLKCVHPDDRDRVNESVMQALAGANGGEYRAEYRSIHPRDGSEHWVTARGQAFFDSEGRAIRFIGTVMDITERKRAEEAAIRMNIELEERIAERTADLARSNAALQRDIEERKRVEEKLQRSERNLAEGQRLTKTGSWILDFKTGNTDWSVETCRIFGFPDPPPSPHYQEFRARVHPDDREGVDFGLRESFETGEPRPLKYRFILPDGVLKHIETISQPVWDDSGEVLRLMGTVMDVTERVKAQEALQQSKDQLRLAIDTIPGLVWVANPDGHVEYHNQRWIDFVGLSPEQASGWGWQAAIHPEDIPGLTAYWKSMLVSGKAGGAEARLRRFDGVYRWFLFRGVPLRDAAGKIIKWYGQNTDIDEQKRAADLVAGEKRLLEMIAQGDALPLILEALCRLAEKLAGDVSVSILLSSADGRRLQHGAAPSLPKRYIEAIDGGAIGPCAGSCGTAAYRGEAVIVTDIATDPLWADYRSVALAYGLPACWSTPIFSTTREVLGTFALYPRKVGGPTPEQHGIVERFAHLASIAIERTLAQEALRRSETYLAEAQRLSLTGSFGWCVETGDIVWSDETYRIFDYACRARPTLEMIFDRVHPEDRALVRRIIEEAARNEVELDFEHRLLMPDGTIKQVHALARATRTKAGDLEFVGALMDITEQKRSQEATRAAKARFEGILAIAEDAIISVDSSQRIVLFNQGAEKVFGFTAAEVIGQTLDLLLPQRFASAHRGHIESFAASPAASRSMGQRREVFGRRKNGSEFPAEASISKLDLGSETVFTVILRDITDRKQTAEALRISERFARGQADALTDALDALARESSPDRIVEHVLRTLIRQLEAHSSSVWLRDEPSGLMVFEAALEEGAFRTKANERLARVSPSLKIEDVWPWPEVFRTGKPYLLADIRQGPEFPWREHVLSLGVVSILIVPMLIAGRVEGVIGIRFSHTRTFHAEEMELAQALAHQAMLAIQLMRLSRQNRESAVLAERNRMARDIHDTLAQGFTGVVVQMEAAEEALSQNLVGRVGEYIGRAGELARESLREARRSVQALRPQALEEKNLCDALQSLMQKMTEGTGMQTAFAMEGAAPAMPPEWEENLLRIGQEVLTNALRHAQASEFKSQLVFDPRKIRFVLKDNGRGFDPAARHDGFGLQGMRERVESMGGRFSVESDAEHGTSITIVLPLAAEVEIAQP